LHLPRLNILVLAPLADARSVLPKPANASVLAPRKGSTCFISHGDDILSFEAILLLNSMPHLGQGKSLLNMQVQDALLVRLPVVCAQSCRLALSRPIWRAHGRCRSRSRCRRRCRLGGTSKHCVRVRKASLPYG
jgi:hypothetical protein